MTEETPDIELLPCPECGETPWLFSEDNPNSPGRKRYIVLCDCGYSYGCTSRTLTQKAYNIHRSRVAEELEQARSAAAEKQKEEAERERLREAKKKAKAEREQKEEQARQEAIRASWNVPPTDCTMPIGPEEPYLYPVPLDIYLSASEPLAAGSAAAVATFSVLSAAEFCLFATTHIEESSKYRYVWEKIEKMQGYLTKLTEILISTDKLPHSPYIASLIEDKRNSVNNLIGAAEYLYRANKTPENAAYLFGGLSYRIFLDMAITRSMAPEWFSRKGYAKTWQAFFKTSGSLARRYDGYDAYDTIERTAIELVRSGVWQPIKRKTTSAASKRKKTHKGKK